MLLVEISKCKWLTLQIETHVISIVFGNSVFDSEKYVFVAVHLYMYSFVTLFILQIA